MESGSLSILVARGLKSWLENMCNEQEQRQSYRPGGRDWSRVDQCYTKVFNSTPFSAMCVLFDLHCWRLQPFAQLWLCLITSSPINVSVNQTFLCQSKNQVGKRWHLLNELHRGYSMRLLPPYINLLQLGNLWMLTWKIFSLPLSQFQLQ